MNPLFPYANILAGVLILIVGFLFHWVGQLISVLNWDLATKLGLQEKEAPPEYKVYEHGTAMADVTIGWIYGLAGLGLILGTSWGYKLAWFPGVILIYHSICYWFWTENQKHAGYQIEPYRIAWFLANFITGGFAVLIAWNGC
jgi:hypothetical protein